MAVAVNHITSADQTTELHRQTDVLVEQGYPALAGLTEQALRDLVAPLERLVPDEPFLLVVSGDLVPLDRLIERTALKGKPGFTTMQADDVRAFRPIADLHLPDSPVYLLADVDTGRETLNAEAPTFGVTVPRRRWTSGTASSHTVCQIPVVRV